MKFFKLPKNKYSAKAILRWLWGAWKGNRLQACLNAGLGLLSVVVSLAQVWAIQRAIDVAAGVREGNIYWAVGVMGALILCDFSINISLVWVRNILGVRAQNRMQQQMLDHLLRSEWQGREQRHSGDVMNRLEQDVKTVVDFLAETLPNTLSVLTLFIGAFLYMFSMDKMLALIIVGIIPVFVAFSKIYMQQMRRLTREVRNSDSEVQSVLQETVQNRMLIKTLEGDSAMVDKLETTQSQLREKVVKRTRFSLFSNLILNFGFALGYLIAFLWAALRMSAHTLSFGGMTAFLQLVNRIQQPARNLTRLAPAFVAVFTAAERLMELEENPLEEQGEPIKVPAPCGIRLTDVHYSYPTVAGEAEKVVLNGLSFDFRPGTCTAILGETGSGKTTLIRIILALLHPQKGTAEIYSGSKEFKEYKGNTQGNSLPSPYGRGAGGEASPLSPLTRCNFVYVPQGNTLMSGSIRDNLLLGDPEATEEMMWEALKKSCADFVETLPEGLNTMCTEKGGGLSEGQCQRISIARALLRNRPVMLFDESTSALDPDTERRLLKNILEGQDKTIIFITHRPAVVDYCDEVVRL